jgi:hypothetical protein
MKLCVARRGFAFQHLLDQVNASARTVEFIAEQLVGRACGGTKTAMHAFAQNGFGFQTVSRVLVFGREIGLHLLNT